MRGRLERRRRRPARPSIERYEIDDVNVTLLVPFGRQDGLSLGLESTGHGRPRRPTTPTETCSRGRRRRSPPRSSLRRATGGPLAQRRRTATGHRNRLRRLTRRGTDRDRSGISASPTGTRRARVRRGSRPAQRSVRVGGRPRSHRRAGSSSRSSRPPPIRRPATAAELIDESGSASSARAASAPTTAVTNSSRSAERPVSSIAASSPSSADSHSERCSHGASSYGRSFNRSIPGRRRVAPRRIPSRCG